MILTAKPRVRQTADRRWHVIAWHVDGIHQEHWLHRVTAMNCSLAIARTSTCATEEERCKGS